MDERWRTSTRSGGNGACVEVRLIDGAVQVRDSKDRTGPILTFGQVEWAAFLDGVKSSEFTR